MKQFLDTLPETAAVFLFIFGLFWSVLVFISPFILWSISKWTRRTALASEDLAKQMHAALDIQRRTLTELATQTTQLRATVDALRGATIE